LGRDATARVQNGADGTEDEAKDEVGGPDPVAGDRREPDEPDCEHDHDGDADHRDDDAEDDAAGGDDGRPDGLSLTVATTESMVSRARVDSASERSFSATG
jgi:hypothetical protein